MFKNKYMLINIIIFIVLLLSSCSSFSEDVYTVLEVYDDNSSSDYQHASEADIDMFSPFFVDAEAPAEIKYSFLGKEYNLQYSESGTSLGTEFRIYEGGAGNESYLFSFDLPNNTLRGVSVHFENSGASFGQNPIKSEADAWEAADSFLNQFTAGADHYDMKTFKTIVDIEKEDLLTGETYDYFYIPKYEYETAKYSCEYTKTINGIPTCDSAVVTFYADGSLSRYNIYNRNMFDNVVLPQIDDDKLEHSVSVKMQEIYTSEAGVKISKYEQRSLPTLIKDNKGELALLAGYDITVSGKNGTGSIQEACLFCVYIDQ